MGGANELPSVAPVVSTSFGVKGRASMYFTTENTDRGATFFYSLSAPSAFSRGERYFPVLSVNRPYFQEGVTAIPHFSD